MEMVHFKMPQLEIIAMLIVVMVVFVLLCYDGHHYGGVGV